MNVRPGIRPGVRPGVLEGEVMPYRGNRTQRDSGLVDVGDHQVASGPEHPCELGEHRGQLRNVGESEGADDHVDVVVEQR
jgi:hypothetical protein